MAIRGPWGGLESLAVLAPWGLVAVGMVLLTVGGVTMLFVLGCQVVAALVSTGVVLWIRYRRREDARQP
jgi:hypothetical protein